MKTCQPCGAVAAVDAPHCPACGEASWKHALVLPAKAWTDAPAFPEAVEPPAVLVPEAPTAPIVPRRRLRGPTNP